MEIDTLESWIEEVQKQHFDISSAAWRLLKLAGQYEGIEVKPFDDSTLDITLDGSGSKKHSVNHAIGKFRMLLARIASFYLESATVADNTALYSFEGCMAVEDNFGSPRLLEIVMKNNNREGFVLTIRCPK